MKFAKGDTAYGTSKANDRYTKRIENKAASENKTSYCSQKTAGTNVSQLISYLLPLQALVYYL